MSSSSAVVAAPTYLYVRNRAPSEDPPFDLALGKALDIAISQFNYYSRWTWRPLLRQAQRCAMAVLRRELERMKVEVKREELDEAARGLWRMLAAWSRSPYTRFLRPKTHALIFIDRERGFSGALYAQPDFMDSIERRYYEVKSFDIEANSRKHVELQSNVFSLLGPLHLVYFVEVSGFFQLREKEVLPDRGIIDDVIAFLQEKPPGSEIVSLDYLRRNYPSRVFIREGNFWKAP
uniref:Uncharacterized protein n=1 Tax=Thermofilum pendens TaxID=2269 RepID=A0A7J3X983_THEPE